MRPSKGGSWQAYGAGRSRHSEQWQRSATATRVSASDQRQPYVNAQSSPLPPDANPEQGNFWRSSGRAGFDIVPTKPTWLRLTLRTMSYRANPLNQRGHGAWLSFRREKVPGTAPIALLVAQPRAIGGVAVLQSSPARPRRWCDAREPPNGRRLRRPAPQDATAATTFSNSGSKQHRRSASGASDRDSVSKQDQRQRSAVGHIRE